MTVPNQAPPRIELSSIVQEYPDPKGGAPVRVVDGIDLVYEGAGINMLLGPSGCGKSTLLHMMGGVRPLGAMTPTSGTVRIDGAECRGSHPDAVMVFQRYLNRPDMTVRQNVELPFRARLWRGRVPAREQARRVEGALESVGLADKAEHRPSQLSGGQNQRVALARALVLRPRFLLMDEPFGALDAQIRAEMQSLLVRLWEEHRFLVVFVTHDITEALLLGDRVTVLSTHPARIADDFVLTEPRIRSEQWLRSPQAVAFADRVIDRLRGPTGVPGGQVRVTV